MAVLIHFKYFLQLFILCCLLQTVIADEIPEEKLSEESSPLSTEEKRTPEETPPPAQNENETSVAQEEPQTATPVPENSLETSPVIANGNDLTETAGKWLNSGLEKAISSTLIPTPLKAGVVVGRS